MRQDIIKAISSSKDITNVIILTHNIDFVFFQTIGLSAFRKCGQPAITIFADAKCAAETYTHQAPVLGGLGTRYRVVPVEMHNPHFRFHPKAILLAGQKTATLFVGSGNLTFGGLRENAEIWARYDTAEDGTSVFSAFHEYLSRIVKRVPFQEPIQAEVEEAFDQRTKSWAVSMEAPAGLLGRLGKGKSLLDQFKETIGSDPVDELLVCAPYFDPDGEALSMLIGQTNAAKTKVIYQPGKSTLSCSGWEKNRDSARLLISSFTHKNKEGESRKAFVHAKFYAFSKGEDVTLILGSANCSRAALSISGEHGNAELQAVLQLNQNQFKEFFIDELNLTDGPVEIDEPADIELNNEDPNSLLRILAARYEFGSIRIAYAPVTTEIELCTVDGNDCSFKIIEPGFIKISFVGHPVAVILRGRLYGRQITSSPTWIDNERDLRATARHRGVVDIVNSQMRPEVWSVDAMSEILNVFFKGLQYLPKQQSRGSGRGVGGNTESPGTSEFTADDVFAPNYETPSFGLIKNLPPNSGNEKITSLQQLILRWFGNSGQPDVTGEPGADDPGEDSVDQPERLNLRKTIKKLETTEKQREKITKLLSQISEMLTSEQFILERSPELLAADLKLVAVFLRIGLREGWISQEDFFYYTHNIWLPLFFSCEKDSSYGWLEYRQRNLEDPNTFIAAMMSVDLSAALVSWVLAVPQMQQSPDYARFLLASALSVARLPWLWEGGNKQEIIQEVANLLALTIKANESLQIVMQDAEQLWQKSLLRGHALHRFEEAIAGKTPAVFMDRILQTELEDGELLWQGTSGFCVVVGSNKRDGTEDVPVLPLQKKMRTNCIRSNYTVPLHALLEEQFIPLTSTFGIEPRLILKDFLKEVSSGFMQN